jgi:hypothetical protein
LSARCSNSPSLRLLIADSAICRLLYCLLCLLVAASLWRLAQRGYPLTALALLPLAGVCCRRLASRPLAGALIRWERGEWTLQQGGICRTLCFARSHCVFPWLIYLAWNKSLDAPAVSMFLFPDSARPDELRRLRVRLCLER